PREGDVLNPFATATELLADLRAGKVASRELTEMYIRRIEQHDGRLNAVVERDFERAREAARAADQGGRGALRGLPITLKESFRVRAASCGVYGHRPSDTRLPRNGECPLPPMPNSALVMAVHGPITRSAPDLELALSILAGPDIGEDVAWRVELPAARRERLADFRVGVLPAIPWITLDDRIASTLEDLATRLDKLGCTVKRVQ